MTPEQQNIAIAEACGWIFIPSHDDKEVAVPDCWIDPENRGDPVIYKVHRKQRDFFQVQNDVINHPGLSFKAKGVLCYLLSKPDTWTPRIGEISSLGPDGKESIQSAMKELEANGFAKLGTERGEHGQIGGRRWDIFEEPSADDGVSPSKVKTIRRETPSKVKPAASKTDQEEVKQTGEKDVKALVLQPDLIALNPIPEELTEHWTLWKKHLKEKKRPLGPTAERQQIKKLLGVSIPHAIAMIEHSIASNWQGLFEPSKSNFQTREDRHEAARLELKNRDYSKF